MEDYAQLYHCVELDMKWRWVENQYLTRSILTAIQAFEKSAFATEVGAATVLTPNGARVLSRLGFSLSRARAVKVEMFETVHSDTMMPITSVDLSQSEAKYGASTWTLHRKYCGRWERVE